MSDFSNISEFLKAGCKHIDANQIDELEDIQSLWSGYGKIVRYKTNSEEHPTVVIKQVCPPNANNHPRGWNTDISHQRKLRSYQVETAWYQNYSNSCNEHCRVPKAFLIQKSDTETWMLMEDLDAAGYHLRKRSVGDEDIQACLNWLAHFHAKFLKHSTEGLWDQGTYWHLATRPDELDALDDIKLKEAAETIDRKLNNAKYKTIVHGDAKLANFCFSPNGKVAAVDFQYVGGGCGMKDVAYFIGSCLNEDECERRETELLKLYFNFLEQAIAQYDSKWDTEELISEWTELFEYAWTDFHRFLKGWSPGHWKLNDYSEKLAQRVLKKINTI